MQRNVNLVDLGRKMRLLSLSEVSIQTITSLLKFDNLADESEKDRVPDLQRFLWTSSGWTLIMRISLLMTIASY